MPWPRLKCIETGKWTRVKPFLGFWDFEDAMHRLVRRDFPGCFAAPQCYSDDVALFEASPSCRRAEVIRSEGDATKYTGRFLTFELLRES